jgi:hypothetical protein
MTPTALVNHGKELEVDLIEAAGEVNNEGRPVGPGHHPAHEALGQPPFQQVRRSCVQPVLGQSEVRRNSRSCGQEWLRQRVGEVQFAVVGYREEIHVPGRAPDEAKCGQRGTADDHNLNVAAQRLQLIGQRPSSRPSVSPVISKYRSVTYRDDEGL